MPCDKRRNGRAGARVLIVAGPAGSGKTTVGRAVAARLGWAFEDADHYHSAEARQKMARGQGLTDADRAPWLARLAALVRQRAEAGPPTVLACSALKRAYRERLDGQGIALVWLHVPAEVLRQRLADREGHIAGPDLLSSQLADAEPLGPDECGWSVEATMPVASLADEIAVRVRP